jgi:hypothetical protein
MVPRFSADSLVKCRRRLAKWFKECGVTTVAMEATGVYWIALFEILEREGLAVILANARQIKNVSGRKSDVLDCQWIQKWLTFGLLQASFRPADPYCVLRTYLRYRAELVGFRSTQCQHMQKALQQMNLQLTQVLSDVTGVSGMTIIKAILEGERDRSKLAGMVSGCGPRARRLRGRSRGITARSICLCCGRRMTCTSFMRRRFRPVTSRSWRKRPNCRRKWT